MNTKSSLLECRLDLVMEDDFHPEQRASTRPLHHVTPTFTLKIDSMLRAL